MRKMITVLVLWYGAEVRYSRIVLALTALVLLLLAAACGAGEDAEGAEGGDDLVASFYPLAFAAKEVAAPGITVRNLTPAGAEPHDLELTASDVRTVREAALAVYLGQGFQPGFEDAVADREGPSVDVLEGLELLPARGDEGADGHGESSALDPHVWLDPLRFAQIAEAIAAALGDPGAADRLVARLERLDDELERGLETCARREIVTSHASFRYLADRYDLDQIALAGLSPEAEPTPRDLARLVEEVERVGATTVFFETLVAPDLAQTVAREADAITAVLDPLEGLSEEQLRAGADYFTVMRENLAVLRRALGCR